MWYTMQKKVLRADEKMRRREPSWKRTGGRSVSHLAVYITRSFVLSDVVCSVPGPNLRPYASASLRYQILTEKSTGAVPGRFASSNCEKGVPGFDNDSSASANCFNTSIYYLIYKVVPFRSRRTQGCLV